MKARGFEPEVMDEPAKKRLVKGIFAKGPDTPEHEAAESPKEEKQEHSTIMTCPSCGASLAVEPAKEAESEHKELTK